METKPLEDNIAKIVEAQKPAPKTQVSSFNRLSGYYQEYIPNYSAIASPLKEFTKMGQPKIIIWGDTQKIL